MRGRRKREYEYSGYIRACLQDELII